VGAASAAPAGPAAALTLARPSGIDAATARLRSEAQALAVIGSKEDADKAAAFLRRVWTAIRDVKAKYQKIRKPFNAALKENQQQEKDDLRAWQEADRTIDAALKAWLEADAALKRAEAQRILREAEDRARQDRERQVAELREAAQQAPTRTDARVFEMQARAVSRAPLVPVVTEQPEAETKLDGVHQVEEWEAVVDDPGLLLQAAMLGQVPIQSVMPCQAFLDEQASALKQDLRYPGVRVVRKTGLRARSL
jgi:hypothetical protein